MSFRKDFHGGRSYAPDAPNKSKPGLIAWVKLQVSRLIPDASSSVREGLPRGKGEGFSFLGFDERHAHARQLDSKVFPMADRRRDAAKAVGQVGSRE
jgi:hypothetical protein